MQKVVKVITAHASVGAADGRGAAQATAPVVICVNVRVRVLVCK